jgi:hypothetical protein
MYRTAFMPPGCKGMSLRPLLSHSGAQRRARQKKTKKNKIKGCEKSAESAHCSVQEGALMAAVHRHFSLVDYSFLIVCRHSFRYLWVVAFSNQVRE